MSRKAIAKSSQVHHAVRVPGAVIDDPIPPQRLGAKLCLFFGNGAGAVHTGAAQQGDVIVLYPGSGQFGQQGRHHQVFGQAAGGIGEHDAHLLAGPGHLC
jgi:hypothetical protein